MARRKNRRGSAITVHRADGSVEVVGAGHFQKPGKPRRPTRRQVFYIRDLRRKLGLSLTPAAKTRAQAAAEIQQLKRRIAKGR